MIMNYNIINVENYKDAVELNGPNTARCIRERLLANPPATAASMSVN